MGNLLANWRLGNWSGKDEGEGEERKNEFVRRGGGDGLTSVTTRKGGIPASSKLNEKKADFHLEKHQKIFVLGT